jgi:hypothetical protein
MYSRRIAIPLRSVIASGAFCLVAALACSGCYKHVIGVSGPGSDAYDIYEPNRRTLDELRTPTKKTAPNKTTSSKSAPSAPVVKD